jgi:hypothetical protein
MAKPVAWRWRWKEGTTWMFFQSQPDEHPNRLMQPLYERDEYRYRDYLISYWMKPIPDRSCDWDWHHKDFDVDDSRYGNSSTLEDAMADIDAQIEEMEE